MSKGKWYVVQVQNGREEWMCAAIEKIGMSSSTNDTPDPPLVKECFTPYFQTQRKFAGEWRNVKKALLPGYVVVVTDDPNELERRLRGMRQFNRLLAVGEIFVPLNEDERLWIEKWTKEGDRTIPMSVARKKGDTLLVTSGPLKGNEGMITRVNRKKSIAIVELTIDGKKITTTVGLAIVSGPANQ